MKRLYALLLALILTLPAIATTVIQITPHTSYGDYTQIYLSTIATLISICSLCLTAWNWKHQNRTIHEHHLTLMFTEYTKRYQDIIMAIPDDVLCGNVKATDPRMRKYITLYFDLCSEEYHLHNKGHIPEDIWDNWKEGMILTTNTTPFIVGWRLLAGNYNKDFRHFINNDIISKTIDND